MATAVTCRFIAGTETSASSDATQRGTCSHARTGGGSQCRTSRAAASPHPAVFTASGAGRTQRGAATTSDDSLIAWDVIRCAAHSAVAQHHSGITSRAESTNSTARVRGKWKRFRRLLHSVDARTRAGSCSTPAYQPVSRERP